MYLKKTITFILILIVLCFISGCHRNNQKKAMSDDVEPVIYPIEDKTLDDSWWFAYVEDVPKAIQEAIYQRESYVAETTGQTVAKVIFDYTQTIKAATYKAGDYAYVYNDSHSALVDAYLEAYFNKSVQYRETKKATFKDVSYEDYQSQYGIIPTTRQIDGYVMNHESIISVKKQSRNEFIITLDGEIAGKNNKINMKELGHLLDYPVFDELVMTVTLEDDLFPISIHLHAIYHAQVAVLGRVKCVQDYTINFRAISDEERLFISSPPKEG